MDKKDIIPKTAIHNVIDMAEKIFPMASKIDGRGQPGGYLCVVNRWGKNVITYLVGDIPIVDQASRFMTRCQNYAEILSSETVNFNDCAVRDNWGTIFSFYGFVNDEVNLAVAVALASVLGDDCMPLSLQKKIVEESKNDHVEHLCELVDDMDLYLKKPLM